MSTIYHSIVGLPRSGKTTFLAALWHLIESGEVATRLVLDKLIGDHRYLNTIAESWRRCEEVARTSMAAETRVDIHVRQASSERRFVLSFPDLSGESFEQQLSSRTCRTPYVNSCNSDGGLLLFLTADKGSDGIAIVDLPDEAEHAAQETCERVREWSPEVMPQQVRVVELLQFLQRPPFKRRPRKLGLVVSAWDVVNTPHLSPASWLKRELPLVDQFLRTNTDTFESRVYGISAQGGDLRSTQKASLLRRTPSERVQCVSDSGQSHDISEPVSWLIEA